jgi:alpha-beta hydrolase superfamily lysophospholipase
MFDHPAFSSSLFFPRRDLRPPPPGAEDRFIRVDGAELHLRAHPAPEARCTLLLFHGNGEVVSDWDSAAPLFAEAGAGLRVVDYRGYGQSTGSPRLRDVLDDVPAVIRAAADERPLIVMGRSLGSLCAHRALHQPEVRGVILESGLGDLRSFVHRRGFTPPDVFSPQDLTAFDPITQLRACHQPLLVLHGERDTLIQPHEAQLAFAAAATEDKELVMVKGRGHNDIGLASVYWKAIARYLARVTPHRGSPPDARIPRGD